MLFTMRRLEAIVEAVKTIDPAFDTFYTSLSDEQKVRIDAGPRRWRWAHRRSDKPVSGTISQSTLPARYLDNDAIYPAISPASVRVRDIFGILGCGSRRKNAKRFVSKSGFLAIEENGGASVVPWR